MTQILKKYVKFLFYALLDAFIAGTGFTLLLTSNFFGDHSLDRVNILNIKSVAQINPVLYITVLLNMTVLFYLLFFLKEKVCRQTVPLSVLFFSVCVLISSSEDKLYLTLVLAFTAAACVYVFKEIFPQKKYRVFEGKRLYIILAAMTALAAAVLSWGCISRLYSFNTSAYDFGIFAQMYESMATDFTQTTTLERGVPMSHFAVHFSPIYYILLPFYMLFRRPEFLLAAQAAVCFSGIIPVLLLCRRYKYGNTVTFFIGTLFLLYPAFTCASFYDFHENVFLTPVILWIMYFIEKNSMLGAVISGLLLLCVKEDAGFYLTAAGIYAVFRRNRPNRLLGVTLTIMGVSGFIGITAFLNSCGEGTMVGRFDAFLANGQDSLKDIVLNVLKNPAYFFYQLLNEEKLLLVMQMFLPLLFIPLRTRRLSDWVLAIPFAVLNLSTDYPYLSSINYQYVYGTGALLFFLFVKNFRYEKPGGKNKTAVAAVLAAAICVVGFSVPKYYNIEKADNGRERYDTARAVLSEIPRGAKIFASTYFTPYLYDCPNIYVYPPLYNKENADPDYVLLDRRLEECDEWIEEYLESGYDLKENDSFVIVMTAPWVNDEA